MDNFLWVPGYIDKTNAGGSIDFKILSDSKNIPIPKGSTARIRKGEVKSTFHMISQANGFKALKRESDASFNVEYGELFFGENARIEFTNNNKISLHGVTGLKDTRNNQDSISDLKEDITLEFHKDKGWAYSNGFTLDIEKITFNFDNGTLTIGRGLGENGYIFENTKGGIISRVTNTLGLPAVLLAVILQSTTSIYASLNQPNPDTEGSGKDVPTEPTENPGRADVNNDEAQCDSISPSTCPQEEYIIEKGYFLGNILEKIGFKSKTDRDSIILEFKKQDSSFSERTMQPGDKVKVIYLPNNWVSIVINGYSVLYKLNHNKI